MARKNKSKGLRLKYKPEQLRLAVSLVKQGTSLSAAARRYHVPRNTVRRHVADETTRPGQKTVFTDNQEQLLCQRILYMGERGFPMTVSTVRIAVFEFASVLQRRNELQRPIPKNWFENKSASYDWWFAFKKRNPELTLRKPEGQSAARAQAFNKDSVESYFNDLRHLFESFDINDYPQLIYNTDETGLSTVPNTSSRVVAENQVQQVQTDNDLPCSSSSINQSSSTVGEPSNVKRRSRKSTAALPRSKKVENYVCCCCEAEWRDATEDWFKCGSCCLWCCESCFGVTSCYECSLKQL